MTKVNIPVLLGSSRTLRQSLKVAEFIVAELQEHDRILTELIDLREYKLPLLEDRLNETSTPPLGAIKLCSKFKEADAILIVTPEYKGGYPAVLKNALDYLEPLAWRYKPIGICTVSSGGFGGINCLSQLQLVCLALGGLPIPDKLPVSNVQELFDLEGNLLNLIFKTKLQSFMKELIWYAEAMIYQKRTSDSADN